MSEVAPPKEPPYVDPFYEERAKRLKHLDNTAKMYKAERLNPSVEQLEDAVQIGYELLENLHQNNVQERLCELTEKATALVERIEAQPKTLHVDLKEQEQQTLMKALEKEGQSGDIKLVEIDDKTSLKSLFDLPQTRTGRMRSDKPNLCGCQVQYEHHSGKTGRVTSNKPNFEEIERKDEEE